jgi:hypothetical protein
MHKSVVETLNDSTVPGLGPLTGRSLSRPRSSLTTFAARNRGTVLVGQWYGTLAGGYLCYRFGTGRRQVTVYTVQEPPGPSAPGPLSPSTDIIWTRSRISSLTGK